MMILKRRARSPIISGSVETIGYYPNGVGGINGHDPVYSLDIGEYKVYISALEFDNIASRIAKVKAEYS